MKIRFAPTVAVLSVLAFLAWIYVSARSDPDAIEGVMPPVASVSEPSNGTPDLSGNVLSDEEPILREQTGGSAVPCAVPLGWRIARIDDSFELSRAEARAALDRAATLWEDAVGRSLFSNESDGALSVRFVDDDRLGSTPEGSRFAGMYREAVHMQEGKVTSVTREIRIYRFSGLDDLASVAAHELGHALGLGHSSVFGSVMREESQVTPGIQPGDIEALRSLCSDL